MEELVHTLIKIGGICLVFLSLLSLLSVVVGVLARELVTFWPQLTDAVLMGAFGLLMLGFAALLEDVAAIRRRAERE